MTPHSVPQGTPAPSRLQRFGAACVRGFHAYATWLVGISWKRFFVFAILLLIGVGILQDLPPFTWKVSETVEPVKSRPAKPAKKAIELDKPVHYDVTIDSNGIRIRPNNASAAASAASGAASAAVDAAPSPPSAATQFALQSITIDVPRRNGT